MILNGVEKSALLLMSIGPDQAAKILKCLTPFEVQKIVTSMVNMHPFSTKILISVLHECYDLAKDTSTISYNDTYLSIMLNKALGEKKGKIILQEALELHDIKIYLDVLNSLHPYKIANLLDQEHPQLITTILVHLKRKNVSQILMFFDDKKRSDIILRIAKFTGIEETSVIELRKVINYLLQNKKLILSDKKGIKIAANILNSIPRKYEKKTIENMYKHNKYLVSEIIKEMYLFKNVLYLEDNCIKEIINIISHEKLYIALHNVHCDIQNKFLQNMSKKIAEEFHVRLEKKSYFSDISIKNEQKLILILAKNILENKKNIQ